MILIGCSVNRDWWITWLKVLWLQVLWLQILWSRRYISTQYFAICICFYTMFPTDNFMVSFWYDIPQFWLWFLVYIVVEFLIKKIMWLDSYDLLKLLAKQFNNLLRLITKNSNWLCGYTLLAANCLQISCWIWWNLEKWPQKF